MRWCLSALMAIGVLAAIDMAPAIAAPAGNFPFCISGDDYQGAGGAGDCSFTSYAQCQATASGRAASCSSNPYYSNAETPPAPGRHSRRRQ
ncbi:MAG: DUF3551 domain-containing protein [Bradyrhizobium sp.]